MKTVKVKTEERNFAMPGEPMTQAAFEAHIKEAENGPFTSWVEGKKEFEEWKKAQKK